MDRIDRAIISILASDARISWAQLGERVNLSASATQRRAEALVKNGVISRFTVDVNPTAVGLGVKAIVSVNVAVTETQNTEALRNSLLTHPRIESAYMVSGSIDYVLEVYAEDLQDLARFLDEELLTMPAIKDVTSTIVLQTIKPHEVVLG